MTVKQSQYGFRPWLYLGTTISAAGTATLLSAPSDSGRIVTDYLAYWLVDPSTSNTVTLNYGTVTVPNVGLSSSRGAANFPGEALPTSTAITLVTSGSASVGVWARYLIATNE